MTSLDAQPRNREVPQQRYPMAGINLAAIVGTAWAPGLGHRFAAAQLYFLVAVAVAFALVVVAFAVGLLDADGTADGV
jgi:hypothetical protein